MLLPESPYYIGIDWAAQTHAVYVLDAAGKINIQFKGDHHADVVARAHDHPHAIRVLVLARAWIRVVPRSWLDGVQYDPDRRGNAAQLHEPRAACH